MVKVVYSCVLKSIKINCKKMCMLLLLGQLCTERAAWGVGAGNGTIYTTTQDSDQTLLIEDSYDIYNINHNITVNGNPALMVSSSSRSPTINIFATKTISTTDVYGGIQAGFRSAGDIIIINDGLIVNQSTGVLPSPIAINFYDNDARLIFTNNKNIIGDIVTAHGGSIIDNNVSGDIEGNIILGTGQDTIKNGGTINGKIDSFFNQTQIVGGRKHITLLNRGTISEGILLDGSEDIITLNGGTLRGGINLGRGANTILVNGAYVEGNIDLGVGDDTVRITSGTIVNNINTTDGSNNIYVGGGVLEGDINCGIGDDNITIAGGNIKGSINLGNGTNTLNFSGISLENNINCGAGDDNITITGGNIKGSINTGDGTNTINFSGAALTGNILGGVGVDKIYLNGGSITGSINGGAGNEIIDVNGVTLNGSINGGDSDDTINYYSGKITGTIDGGFGANILNINGDFTTDNTISNIQTINVNSPAIFTIKKAISQVDTKLLVNSGATVQLNEGGSVAASTTGSNAKIENYGNFSSVNGLISDMAIDNKANSIFRIDNNSTTFNTIKLNSLANAAANGVIEITNRSTAANAVNLGNFDSNAGTCKLRGKLIRNQADFTNTGTMIFAPVVDNDMTQEIFNFTAFTNNGTVIVKLPINLSGTYSMGNNAIHELHINNDIAATMKLDNGSVNFVGNNKLRIKNNSPLFTKKYVVIKGNSSPSNITHLTLDDISSRSVVIQYKVEADGNNVILDVMRTPYYEFLTNTTPNTITVGTVLTNLANNPNNLHPDLRLFLANLDQSTAENIAYNIDQVVPDLSITRDSELRMQSSSMILEQINDRLKKKSKPVKSVTQEDSGYAAGDFLGNKNYWVKAVGNSNQQKALLETHGYRANVGGLVLGCDKSINSKMLLGVGFSYTNTKVNSKDLIPDKSRTQSSQFIVYGNYSQAEYYVNAYLVAGLNKYRTDRVVAANHYHAKFSGFQPSMKIDIGIPKVINQITITPNAAIHYNHLRLTKHNETGAGGLGLNYVNIVDKNMHVLRGGLGAKCEIVKTGKSSNFIPELRVNGLYDLINTQPKIHTEFQGGGDRFVLTGDKAKKFILNLGASLNYIKSNGFSVSLNYDLYMKKKFIGQGGSLLAKFSM